MAQSRQFTSGMKYLIVAFLLVAGIGCQQKKTVPRENKSEPRESVLGDASFATWRDRILTKESELLWEKLPWLTTYREGLEQAAAQGKPLLLWVMNGHPLGCT